MTQFSLPTGSQFVRRVVWINVMLSALALAIVFGSIAVLIEMTDEMWRAFLLSAAAYTVLLGPGMFVIQRRAMRPVCDWLDARETSDAETTAGAFRALMALPQTIGLIAALVWLGSTLAIAVAMELRFDAWSLWEWCVLGVGGIAAGFTVGTITGFLVKGGQFEGVREELAAATGGPEERRAQIQKIPIRTKLLVTVAGAVLVPVAFALMLAIDQSDASLEEFGVGWSARMLGSLPNDFTEADVAALRARLAGPELPAAMTLAPLDQLEQQLAPTVVNQVRAAIEAGERGGDSARLSDVVLAWRLDDRGRAWVASVALEDLRGETDSALLSLALLMSGAVIFALAIAYFLAEDMSVATRILTAKAQRLASGDLRRGRIFEAEDEMGELSRSFDVMAENLRATVGQVAEAADRVEAKAEQLSPVSVGLSEVTSEQVAGIERAAASMEEINAQVSGIARSSQALNGSVEESSSSILELGASGEELNETASLLSSKVEEVSTSIEQMVHSVKQVSENTESLSSAAEETSASMEEMASSLREVDTTAEEASRLSSTVVERAESGQNKVRQTIDGMEAIRSATELAEEVIKSLHGRTVEIGAIVDVIDDVADETNLLALNAAIIAAQAGEQGRAFSVVADEIKDLAERVLTSTKEIGALIHAVQDEARKATGAIEQGSASVASGVDLSAEAGMALEQINAASRESGSRISGIVGSLREQARAAGHVVDLMERVRGGVDEIRAAAAEQDRGNVVVYQGSVTMREVSQQVRGTTEEQARGSGRIRESVEGVREAVEQINAALQEQSQACASAVEFLEAVRGRMGANEEATRTVEEISKDLLSQADSLRQEVQRFQI